MQVLSVTLFPGLEVLKNKLLAEQETNNLAKTSGSNAGPLVVVYNDPSKRKKLRKIQASKIPSSKKETESVPSEAGEFNLIKAKHDVRQFTIKSMKKINKRQAQIEVAVSLGAKAPKVKAINLKVLKNCQKNQIAKQKKLKESEHVFVNKIQLTKKKKMPIKNKNKVVNFDAKFGKFGSKLKKQMKVEKSKKNG